MPNSPYKKAIEEKAISANRHLAMYAKEDGITKQAAYLRARSFRHYVPVAVQHGLPKSRAKDTTLIAWVRTDLLKEWVGRNLPKRTKRKP